MAACKYEGADGEAVLKEEITVLGCRSEPKALGLRVQGLRGVGFIGPGTRNA